MRYETLADAKLRLGNSVVRVKDKPAIVIDVHPGAVASVQLINSGENINVKIKDLELTPVPLGYINHEDGALLYAMRKPTRRYKQGLTNENLMVINTVTGAVARLHLMSESLGKTIEGVYPSIEECFTSVREGTKKALAFSREWAVGMFKEDIAILYKGGVVGYVGDTSVMLNPEKYFLKESLTEALNV